MTHISKYKLSKKLESELMENLTIVLASIAKKDEMNYFLNALLTDTEKVMLAKRLALIIMINEGYNDSQIANTLHLTRITVAKTRYFFESRGEGYKVGLRKLESIKDTENVKKLLRSLSRYSIRAAGGRL
jgi:uncharacterized protein YerC